MLEINYIYLKKKDEFSFSLSSFIAYIFLKQMLMN